LSALACIGTALVANPLRAYLDAANIVMLFMLTVLVVALRAGRGPAVLPRFSASRYSISSSFRRVSRSPSTMSRTWSRSASCSLSR
jgi:hypothetical protein